jgi:hypothetical protein
MADARSLFEVVITAIDRLSAPFERMSAQVHRFDAPIREVGERLEHLGEAAGIERIGERFHELRESIGETAEKLSEFVGPFAILAGVGSAAGLVELANKVSESGERIHDSAIKIGIDAESLQKLEFGAKLNSVPVDTFETALTKLNRVLADSASGKNKDAANMFRHLGISLRDAQGHVLSAAAIFPKLADAIQRNENPAIRTRIAVTAFSRAGAALIPYLEKGGAALNKYSEEAEKAGIMTNEQVNQAKEFADKSAVLRASIEGVANAIGARLFPVLQPVVERITLWVQVNEKLIATKVEHAVELFGNAVAKIDWDRLFDGLKATVKWFGGMLDSTGKLETALIVLGAVMVGPFVASLVTIGANMTLLATSTIPLLLGAFTGLVGFAATASVRLGLVAESLAGLTTAVPLLSGALEGLSGVFLAVGAAIEATPIGWILTGIAAIGASAYVLIFHWDRVKAYFGVFITTLGAAFATAKDVLSAQLDGLGAKFSAVGQVVVTAWQGVRASFISIWDGIAGAFDSAYQRIKPIIDAITDNRITRALGLAGDRIGQIGGIPTTDGGAGGGGATGAGAAPVTGSGPIVGGAGASGRIDGEVRVKIDMPNLPPGARATTTSSGQVAPETNVGWNMRDPQHAY